MFGFFLPLGQPALRGFLTFLVIGAAEFTDAGHVRSII
jgi:hypothetical protein